MNRERTTISLERLKEKIGAVTTNVAIYTDHLNRYKKELKKNYDLSIGEAKDRLVVIEEMVQALQKRHKRLLKEATNILDGIEDE